MDSGNKATSSQWLWLNVNCKRGYDCKAWKTFSKPQQIYAWANFSLAYPVGSRLMFIRFINGFRYLTADWLTPIKPIPKRALPYYHIWRLFRAMLPFQTVQRNCHQIAAFNGAHVLGNLDIVSNQRKWAMTHVCRKMHWTLESALRTRHSYPWQVTRFCHTLQPI